MAPSSHRPVAQLGLGTAPLGNLYTGLSDEAARRTLERAWEHGIRMFDTAPHYGLGLAERRLGRLLAGVDRDQAVISTKVGLLLDPLTEPAGSDTEGFAVPMTHRRVFDYSPAGVRRSLEASLERMGLERVDIALVQDPGGHLEQAIRETLPALVELRAAGVLSAVGLGMNHTEPLVRAVRDSDQVDVVLLAGRWTLLDQSGAELLAVCQNRGVDVIAGGIYNSGILAEAADSDDSTYDYAPATAELRARVQEIRRVCGGHGVTVQQAALAFVRDTPAISQVLVGVRSAEQVDVSYAAYADPALDPERLEPLWDELQYAGLLAVRPGDVG